MGEKNHFLSGRAAVAQAIKTRLLLLLGEWWEDIEDGLPLFESILATFRAQDDAEDVDLIFSERIAGTQNVIEILDFNSEFNPNTRTYSASCKVSTAFGPINVQIGENGTSRNFITVNANIKEGGT